MTGDLRAKRVLLTGASGFIGRQAVAPLLARGYEVHAVRRRGSPRLAEVSASEVHWHSADLLGGNVVDELMKEVAPTHLLHFAWYAEHGRFWSSPENVRWLEASLRLLRAFQAVGGSRAVLAGTCAEYDWSALAGNPGALASGSPATLYGRCKLALNEVTEALWRAADRPSVAWGRIFFLHGPGEDPARLVPSVAGAVLGGEPARCSPGTQIRDFLHSTDVADAFVALLDSPVLGGVDIGSGEPVTIAEVVNTIGELLGRPELIVLGALAARPEDPDVLVADTARLRNEVGWCPGLSLREGLERTLDWWREQALSPVPRRPDGV